MRLAAGNILRKGWRALANLSMEKKLIVIFVFLLTLPITYVSYLSARSTFNSVLKNASSNAAQVTGNASDTVDRYVSDLKRSTLLPLYNTEVQYYLQQPVTDWGKNVTVGMFLSYLKHTKDEITAVYLVDKYGSIFYDKATSISQLAPAEQLDAWKNSVAKAGTSPVLEGRHTIRVNGSGRKEVFTVLRKIKSASALDDIGIIVFDTDIELFKGILDPVDSVTQGSSMIIDGQGQLVYATGSDDTVPDRIAQLSSSGRDPGGGFYESDIRGVRFLTVYHHSRLTGWTVSVDIPLSKVLSEVKQNRNTLQITTLLLLTFALFVATLFSHALTRPLKSMVRLMRQVQHGNLDVWIHAKYNDEIGMLGTHFNRMIIRIKELLQEVKLTEKRKQKADMRALQSQINPHFIYNTLESIRMLAESNDDPRVAQLTYLLGLQMRYSIVRQEEKVTVRQELEHVRHYMDLMQIRFPGKFELKLDVPEPLMSLPVIKLVFQPIVENAVFHGLEAKPGTGTVTISAFREDGGRVVFRVEDDGVGMDESKLKSLNESLEQEESDSPFGIGLHNVNERLQLHYGRGAGLQVESTPGGGTCVRLTLQEERVKEEERSKDERAMEE
ncbi:sensor histidine kinase [Paenibacillus sp. CN-4]|uniref:cache domain-containing sensor histidine kinase n=1 Tax=Paenibacillus nanchangensis TaxID=3348343 RepID=UPI00397C07FE